MTPEYSRPCQTPWSVFLDGSVVPITSVGASHAPAAWVTEALPSHCNARKDATDPRTRMHRPRGRLDKGREAGHNRVSSCRFQVLFNSLFKVLCIFPSRYLFAIGHEPIFSFRWNLPPTSSCNPKQPDSAKTHRAAAIRHGTGLSPSPIPCSKGFERRTRPMAPF